VVAVAIFVTRPAGGPTASGTASSSASVGAPATGVAAPSGATAAPSPASTPDEPAVTLIAVGDIASCTTTGDSATAKLVDGIPGTVAVLGDAVYPSGTASQFRDCYRPTWGRFLDRTRPVPGNHEYLTANASAYFAYFGARAGDPVDGWYAYDLGAWRVYALNSNCHEIGGCDAGSRQVAWLRADLAANPRDCVLAYWHHPRFSSGRHGSQAQVAGLWNALADAGAELVLNGHDHGYERFAPQSGRGSPDPDGIVEFVVGTGGFTHYEFPNVLATSRSRDNASFGVLQLTLRAGSWTARFVPVEGASFTDEASGACH
jgi:acid phosphatase type 7